MLRETLITNPIDRQQTQFLARRIGDYLEELNNATRPLVNLLKNLELGELPNRFRIVDMDGVGQSLFDQNSQNQLNNYLNPNPNSVRIEQEISISIASGNIGPANANNLNQNNNQNANISNSNANTQSSSIMKLNYYLLSIDNNVLNHFFDIQSILGNLARSNQTSSSPQTGSGQTANLPPPVIPLPQNGQTIPIPENLHCFDNNSNPIHLNAANPLGSLAGMLSVTI